MRNRSLQEASPTVASPLLRSAPRTPGGREFARPGLLRSVAGAIVVFAPLVLFALLGREARRGRVFGWDAELWRFLQAHEESARGSILDRAVNVLVEMGGDIATLLLGLLILSILLRRRRMRDAVFLLIATASIVALTPLLKQEFVRTGMKYSFPSGHAARSATVVAPVVVIAWPTRYRWLAVGLGSVFTATLGTALVYEDWHLPSDVLGGWCLGVACVGAGRAALYGPFSRRRTPVRGRLWRTSKAGLAGTMLPADAPGDP